MNIHKLMHIIKNKVILSFILFVFSLINISLSHANVIVNIDINEPEHHLAKVTMSFEKSKRKKVNFNLPTWRTGRYEILNLANGIRDFSAVDSKGNQLDWQKIDKDTWQVINSKNKKIQISYQVYANQLGKRTRHIDDSHAFLDASTVLMYSDSSRKKRHIVNLVVPDNWHSVSGLSSGKKPNQFVAKNYDILVDSPIETGINEHHKFEVDGRDYELVIWGKGNYDSKKMVNDLKSMVAQTEAIWQGVPFSRYVFMVHATGGERGATEHLNSTIIQRSRFKFSSRKDYLGFISTAAHEFIHTWNVKQYRPEGLVPYNYQNENYSNLLWVAEGSTSYLQDQLLLRGDLMSSKEFLNNLAKRITGYMRKPGRFSQSVAQASFNKWIDEGGDYGKNNSVNIYSEGYLVSWLLDFNIIDKTQLKNTYRDVHNVLYQKYRVPKSYNEKDMLSIIEDLTGSDYSQWWQKNVHGYANPDFNKLLAKAGLTISYGKKSANDEVDYKIWVGIKTRKSDHGLKVVSVEKNGPAWQAGFTIGDVIVAVDGLRLTDEDLNTRLKNFKPTESIKITFFRRDELMDEIVKLDKLPKNKLKIEPIKGATKLQKSFFKVWTGVDFPEK